MREANSLNSLNTGLNSLFLNSLNGDSTTGRVGTGNKAARRQLLAEVAAEPAVGAAPAAATIASSAPVDEAQSVVVLEKDIWCRCWRCCQPEGGYDPSLGDDDDDGVQSTSRLPSSRTTASSTAPSV